MTITRFIEWLDDWNWIPHSARSTRRFGGGATLAYALLMVVHWLCLILKKASKSSLSKAHKTRF